MKREVGKIRDSFNDLLNQQHQGGVRKGSVSFSPKERPVMYLFTDHSDLSTFLHESAHIFRRALAPEHQAALAKVFGNVSSVRGEEKFARGFERYLTTGKAPTHELQSAFQDIRSQMLKVYGKIKGSEIEASVDPRLRRVFDKMLGQGAFSNFQLPKHVSLPVNPANEGKKRE